MADENIDKYHDYRRTKAGIDKLRTKATKLSSEVFTEAYAEQGSDQYVQYASAIISRMPQLHGVTLSASGNDVLVPNIDQSVDDNFVGFSMNFDQPRRPLGNLINVDGVFKCISVERNELEEGGVQLNPILYIARSHPQFDVPGSDGKPFTQFSRIDYTMVPLDERADSRVSVKVLDLLKDKKEAFVELSLAGLAHSTFTRGLKSLNKAFSEECEEFVLLKNVDALRHVGRQGKVLTEKKSNMDNAVTSSTLKTLGSGRSVVIESDIIHTALPNRPIYSRADKINGHILDVCSELYGVPTESLMLVVKPSNGNELNFVPLSTVTNFWF